MSYQQEKQDIEEWFQTEWIHTPIAFENKTYDGVDEWVRLTIQNGPAFQASMGDNPAFRFTGVVFVQIFTTTDTGSGRAVELVDIAETMFRNLVLTNLRFKVSQVKKMGKSGELYQINVSTEFYRGS